MSAPRRGQSPLSKPDPVPTQPLPGAFVAWPSQAGCHCNEASGPCDHSCSAGSPTIKHNYHLPWVSGKESTCRCRRPRFYPWVRKIPWRRKWQPTPVLLPEESHGLRVPCSLVGYSLLLLLLLSRFSRVQLCATP